MTAAVIPNMHRQACTSPTCSGCYPDIQHRPLRITYPGPGGKLVSDDARRTAANRDLLDSGVHPATLTALLIGASETCKTCTHHQVNRRSKTYHKCDLHRLGLSGSAASDIRVRWPACAAYETAVEIRR